MTTTSPHIKKKKKRKIEEHSESCGESKLNIQFIFLRDRLNHIQVPAYLYTHSISSITNSWEYVFSLSCVYKHTYYHHHHHHVVPPARISLTLSLHFSLLFITSGRSSRLYPVPSHSCCMYVRAGRPAFDCPYAGVHRSTSLTISSLLLQQCPACLVRLAWIVFVIGGRWPYSWCLVGCCCQDLFNIALNILVWLLSSFFSNRLVSVQVVHPYSSIDTTAAWKKLRFTYYTNIIPRTFFNFSIFGLLWPQHIKILKI